MSKMGPVGPADQAKHAHRPDKALVQTSSRMPAWRPGQAAHHSPEAAGASRSSSAFAAVAVAAAAAAASASATGSASPVWGPKSLLWYGEAVVYGGGDALARDAVAAEGAGLRCQESGEGDWRGAEDEERSMDTRGEECAEEAAKARTAWSSRHSKCLLGGGGEPLLASKCT